MPINSKAEKHDQVVICSFPGCRTGAITLCNLDLSFFPDPVKRLLHKKTRSHFLISSEWHGLCWKSGEIIPKIVGVDHTFRNENSKKMSLFPIVLNVALNLLKWSEANHFCPNYLHCPQIKGRIEHFISRKAMNIDGLGEETVDLCSQEPYKKHFGSLRFAPWPTCSTWTSGEKSASNILKSIKNRLILLIQEYFLLLASGMSERQLQKPSLQDSGLLMNW